MFFPAANEAGETPLDIARRLRHLQCEEMVSLLRSVPSATCTLFTVSRKCVRAANHLCLFAQLNQALAGKFNAHVHVEYEWCLQHEDLDESDEDLDEKVRRTQNVKYSFSTCHVLALYNLKTFNAY